MSGQVSRGSAGVFLKVHFSVDRHWFHFLAIMNNPAMNINVQFFIDIFILTLLSICLEVELKGYMVALCLMF